MGLNWTIYEIFKCFDFSRLLENMNVPEDENMELNEHPTDRHILEYLKAPDAVDQGDLRLHLAGCHACRRRADLVAMLRDRGHCLDSGTDQVDPRVADLVGGNLAAGEAESLRREIKQDPAALRAALHYASHARAMREIAEPASGDRIGSKWLKSLLRGLSFEAPLWQVAPALAVVMTVAVLVFNQFDPERNTQAMRIVAFQDNPVLQFSSHETQPGIGFFSQADADSRPFAGMTIELQADDRLRLSWPEIPGASDYNLKLQVFRDGQTHLLARRQLKSTATEIQLDEPLTQHRYEWVLSGNTVDQGSFQVNGGFVITVNPGH